MYAWSILEIISLAITTYINQDWREKGRAITFFPTSFIKTLLVGKFDEEVSKLVKKF